MEEGYNLDSLIREDEEIYADEGISDERYQEDDGTYADEEISDERYQEEPGPMDDEETEAGIDFRENTPEL